MKSTFKNYEKMLQGSNGSRRIALIKLILENESVSIRLWQELEIRQYLIWQIFIFFLY